MRAGARLAGTLLGPGLLAAAAHLARVFWALVPARPPAMIGGNHLVHQGSLNSRPKAASESVMDWLPAVLVHLQFHAALLNRGPRAGR